jgi:hypothetical protein
VNDYVAEAFFAIEAPDRETAKRALAVVVDAFDDTLREISRRDAWVFENGVEVRFDLENTHGEVEDA